MSVYFLQCLSYEDIQLGKLQTPLAFPATCRLKQEREDETRERKLRKITMQVVILQEKLRKTFLHFTFHLLRL
jgi:hypothetical protein